MELTELFRRWKRSLDNIGYRKLFFLIAAAILIFIYCSPAVLNSFTKTPKQYYDVAEQCIEDRLTPFYIDELEFNAYAHSSSGKPFLPFVGNGNLGLAFEDVPRILLKPTLWTTHTLPWDLLVTVNGKDNYKLAAVTRFLTGIVHVYHCYDNGVHVSYRYFAHRTFPFLLVQEIKIVNPNGFEVNVELNQSRKSWSGSTFTTRRAPFDGQMYNLLIGSFEGPSSDKVLAVCSLFKKQNPSITVRPHQTVSLEVYTVIHFEVLKRSEPVGFNHEKCFELMSKVSNLTSNQVNVEHVNAWYGLWKTGLSISYSKASNAINGDQINATIYYVLSHVRSLLHQVDKTPAEKAEYAKSLDMYEGCYGGYHHTLQAINLWGKLATYEDIKGIVSFWLLTLEKQGCSKLLNAGADGVMQAMILSMGGFKFKTHHLEFNVHPKYLHRDYFFRRIRYGPNASINITVTLQEDNKAMIGVALEKSQQAFYACDGGCMDEPVQLGSSVSMFPVKQTDPITAILYITPDKEHIELLQHTLHVHQVVEAPAHEHHVIALHRHGHHFGGLPTLFWSLICFLIIIFHLFLCKLIYNEYCDKQDKYVSKSSDRGRARYSRL